jgi:hypothetical protein
MAADRKTTPSSAAESFFIITSISHAIVMNGNFDYGTNKVAIISLYSANPGPAVCAERWFDRAFEENNEWRMMIAPG